MTEEIIIDGVDMSGCCCYENGKCLWTKRYYENNIAPDCEKVKDCYYKQLKRLEQEKDKYYQQTLDDEILMNELSLEVDLRKKESDFYLEKLSKYRCALEEINKITEPRFVNGLNEEADLCNLAMDRIQNKINEVLK